MTKTAIITGAAKNIGKGIARELLKEGYECILLDKDNTSLTETAKELRSIGDCIEYVVDIANTQQVDGFLEWLHENSKEVDVVVNNVGYESEATVRSLTPEEIAKSYTINLAGPFYLTSALVSKMVHGSIIFITSTHSTVTRMHPLYSSSKAAIDMFMKEAALELASKNIRVNAIAPGPVMDTVEPHKNKYVPLGYSQQPEDVAAVVSFLVSNKARFITGQTITVDGGFTIAHTHYWKNQERL